MSFTFRLAFQLSLLNLIFVGVVEKLAAQKTLPDGVGDLSTQIAQHVAKEQKTRVAVIPFRELGGEPTVLGTYLAEELVTHLVNAGNLDLVERATLDKVMGELKFNESGAIDPSAAKQVGKLVGADAIITGTITDLQSYVGVNCRLIDTQTGRIFAAAETRIVKDDDVKKILTVSMPSAVNTGKISPAPVAPSRALPSVSQNDFLFVMKSCEQKAERTMCIGAVTNKADKLRTLTIGSGTDTATIVDSNGNSYPSDHIGIGQPGAFNGSQTQIMPDLPTNFFLQFTGVDQSVTTVSVIINYYASDGMSQWSKALFRNIPLVKK